METNKYEPLSGMKNEPMHINEANAGHIHISIGPHSFLSKMESNFIRNERKAQSKFEVSTTRVKIRHLIVGRIEVSKLHQPYSGKTFLLIQ